jgi:predicted O-methyltransferase YrrM
MDDTKNLNEPASIRGVWHDTVAHGFNMYSEPLIGSLLRTLAASKPNGHLLELSSGPGLSTAWLLDSMNDGAQLTTVDNDPALLNILEEHLGADSRLTVTCADGDEFIRNIRGKRFDLIFADTWSGKYRLLPETLELLRAGGLYVIDDMLRQPNWPEGHEQKVDALVTSLENHPGIKVTKMAWASGVIIAAKV